MNNLQSHSLNESGNPCKKINKIFEFLLPVCSYGSNMRINLLKNLTQIHLSKQAYKLGLKKSQQQFPAMQKQTNKENKPISNLNVPQMKLKLSMSRPCNQPQMETQRSPKINTLFQRIQQSIEVKTDNQPQVTLKSSIPYHQMKIREKLRGQNNTPTVQISTQDSKDSFNIWNDDKQLEGNLIENYLHRYKSHGTLITQSIQHDEIAENLLQLMGMKHKMKNLGNIPFFVKQQQQEKKTNYFLPSQKFWKLNNKKKVKTYNSIVQNSTQQSFLQNKLNSYEVQFQNLENLRKLNSPDILKMKFKQFYNK